ncbi:SDR family NAD(P)-dependent oxidoreductase [Lactobacillus xylocopicola]|uniref:3-oxoacyl-ACP reductase n=1 Tax=Lactobacillus xylocopicola TaxID=2976676 RepID=A0ABM8BG46_9LACO|nr:SDR family oxidoreductase [Lactobacillus xylocopicola]BDR60228.1 3-oxoacyl-ACP reductase [Lactobacillus xylocopicola]
MQRAIIFGASGGIGRAISEVLAGAGWSLYIHCSTNWSAASDLSAGLSHRFPQQDFIPVKFSFLAEDSAVVAFVNHLLPVNALVFAQGITDYQLVNGQELTKVDQLMQVNLITPIKLTNLLEPVLTKNEFSRIVYLGSVYGGDGSAMEAVYSSSKAGLERFAQSYAREVASANLTVNVLAPGAVDTAMNAQFDSEAIAALKAELPIGRLATTSDIAFWVKTLLDRQSGYLTGQTIYVSGGWLK